MVPGVDDCGSPEIQDGGKGSTTSTETEKHSELLKLAEGDRERAQDSVQYPGKHHQRLIAMERPQSVPQKAVHFLDDEPKAEDRVVPRSKSAHPRITGRVRGNSREGSSKENGRRSGSGRGRKVAATECRDESLIDECGGDKDRDDDGGDGNGGGAPTGESKGVGSLPGGEGDGNGGGGTDSGVSDDRGGQGKQQSLGLQKDIVIMASVGGVNTRRASQLIGDARGVLVVVSKTAPSRGKCQTQSSDGKPRNKQVSRNIRAKTAGSAQAVARMNAGVRRSQRPHTAHGSSLNLDLEFTRDSKEEIVAHGDVCFVGSELAATRTKTAAQSTAKTTKHSGENITDGSTENIKVGLCTGCSKVSMLIKAGTVAIGRRELCCNCLLKVDVVKAQTLETSDVREKENLRNATGKEKHKIQSEATAELTSNDSDYGSNSDENAFMTCFSDLEASMLLARQEIRAEMAETNTDLCLVPVDKDIGDDSESDEGSFNESSDEGTGDEVVEILARCFDECISITGSVGAISEYLTNTEYYKSKKAKQHGSEIAPVHKVQSKQSGLSSGKTSEHSESLGKDVRSGDVTNYEVMLMKGYSANVEVPTGDAEADTPFLELMCRCLPEPAKVREMKEMI